MKLDVLPHSVDDLIAALNTNYPDRCWQRGESLEDAAFRAGQRDVVDFLLVLQKRTREKGLKGELLHV